MSGPYVPEIAIDREGNEHVVQGWQDDFYGGKLGFWLFMFTEVLMFGAMFMALAYYNTLHPQDFLDASASLNRLLGGINTVVLLVSALTMGLGLLNMRVGKIKEAKLMIWATIILAAAFLVIKGFEWRAEYNHGIFLMHDQLLPGSSLPFGQKLFFGLYFTMTGLHGFHIIIGIGLMIWLLKRINAEKVRPDHHILHWNIALYWDIVHLIWVFVFPYYYMIGAGGATGGH
ncbi:MAG: Cytochrome c oxidase polypeptide III (EC [uncultured Sulfurovum sp.]|uniref:Cytochrome c oxidase polypeptide III (EC) n=1 Tax=uncultured Sulfurovum sp. TaxID=269237 RepID=A0A6S6T5Q7_9BACT|nr:MAG: Cytochrome c oxidase polypeptide III (EC [uncultured Sulfurovum sp.]